MKKRILSGMRPTGKLHLGHLVGALDNWVKLQDEYECFFMVADWHALMSEYEDTSQLAENRIDNTIDWLSAGVDPEKSTVFIQSGVREHLDLYMVLSCFTPLGWLERCPTYKEQLREVTTRNLHTYAFLGYPVLQAADILLYKAGKVPVGEDQLPHLELTREIARRFNGLYKSKIFPEPEAILTPTPRLLGLDGRKMSKSYNNTLNLSDPEEVLRKKIGNMFTDPKRVLRTDKGHPETCNVHAYYGVFLPEQKDEVERGCRSASLGCTDCKKMLAAGLIEKLKPFHERREGFLKDKAKVKRILEKGTEKARAVAAGTFSEVREAMGLPRLA
ncbi:MAG: tryptophan--tRNA ligase [Candidatus Omnitrophica bacterium]|nr:tryptophan--tRNA ligase [Candidatus Omnitrophota bacterium]